MWKDTILTQYSASAKLISIIETFNQAVSLDDFTDEFIAKVWDLATCETFGLDMWSKIVGVSRYITAPIESGSFGLSEADDSDYPTPFNDSPFFGGVQETTNVRQEDDAYRTLIFCKAFTNISIVIIPDINKFLRILFYKRERACCVNYRDMTMGMIFEFEFAPYEVSILTNYDVTPIPSGVLLNINQVISPYFGFSSDVYPFNDGTFYRD
ncbi:TPA: DUF2612 domain-containing protein [Kluyvera georgiana]